MGSTATDDMPAKKAGKSKLKSDDSKAGAVRKTAARKAPAGKKASGKKTVARNRQTDAGGTEKPRKKPAVAGKQAAGKSRRKSPAATRKTAGPENVTQQTVELVADADPAEVAAAAANTADEATGDSRSISWMSAQAVSALNAVKASQAIKAESLLARVEKPVPGKPGITELPEQTSEDLLEEIPEPEAAAPAVPAPVTSQETTTSSPAAAGDAQTIQKEASAMQEKPDEQESTAAEAAETKTENVATEAPATPTADAVPESGAAATASKDAVVAAQAQPRGLPARPIVMTVFLAMLAYSGYHYWQDNREPQVTAPPVTDSFTVGVESASYSDIPQQEAIAVVGTTTEGEQPASATTAPGQANEVPAQPDTSIDNGFAATTATDSPGSAADGDTGVTTAQPAAETAPSPAAQAEMKAAEPAEATAAEPAQPAQPQPQPQPRYGAPGYGYYPQQPNWQQPYYQPAYPQQYPAR